MKSAEANDGLAILKRMIEETPPAALVPRARAGVLSQAELNARLDPILKQIAVDQRRQKLIRGTLLLWHDHLDASHSIAQSIEDADGSLLHAMMHRREPDYSNAKYWLRSAGKHPLFTPLAAEAAGLLEKSLPSLATRLLPNTRWDPFAFVDACESASRQRTNSAPLEELQRLEFIHLLQYLCRQE